MFFSFKECFFFFFVGWVSNWNSSCFPKLWLSSSRLSIGDPDHGYVKAVVDAICMAKWPSKSMRSLHEAPGFSTLWMKTLFPFFQLGFCIFFFGEILESQFPIPEVGMFFLFFLQKHSSKALGDFWGVFIGASKELFFFVQFLALEKLVDFRNGRQKLSPTGSYRIGESFWIFDLPSRELTCPTFGKGLSSSKAPWDEIC